MKRVLLAILLGAIVFLPGCLTTKSSSGQIGVIPETALVGAGSTQPFSAALTGSLAGAGVTWSVSGSGCASNACGAIDSNGNFTAPATPPANLTIQVIATSKADKTKSAFAIVTLGPAVTFSVSPSTTQTAQASQQIQFIPTLGNTSNTTVTWTVTGTTCTAAACGTITPSTVGSGAASAATYTAPSVLPPVPASVTVKGTPTADPSKAVSITVNLVSHVNITPSNGATVPVLQSFNFTAAVVGPPANQSGVTWNLTDPNGTACNATTCGTLTSVAANSVTYVAPQFVPTTPSAILTATAQFDGQKTSAIITIVALNTAVPEARLFGRYAFVYRGYPNVTGTPTVEAGSLVFDGQRNVVGVEDDNNGTTPHAQVAVSGTYSIQEADGRGTITLNAGLARTLQIVVLSTSDSTVAPTAYLTDFGGSAVGAGRMELQQNPGTLTLGSLTSGYAVSLRGGPVASAVGRFDLNGSGTINNMEVGRFFADSSFGTCPTPTISPSSSYTISSGTYGPLSTTTGQVNFAFQNAQIGASTNLNLTFSGYVVSPSKVFLVETDNTGFTFLGAAEKQSSASFGNGDFNGLNSYLAQSNNGPGAGNSTLGPVDPSGAGSIDEFQFFGNIDGLVPSATAFQDSFGNYSIQSNGTGLATFCDLVISSVQTVPRSNVIMYMVSPSKIFAWAMDGLSGASAINDTLGEMDSQQGGPFTSLLGTYAFTFEGVDGTFTGSHTPTEAIAQSGIVVFDGSGNATFTFDVAQGATLTTGKSVTATYKFNNDLDGDVDDDSSGTLTFTTTPPFKVPDHFVVVSANKIFFTRQNSDSNVGGIAEKQ
jgi:hypothetical protein